ncbi:hypothetical protein [Plantibacter sp. M259]|uniref:hypothetical protein n=1 Tax=Plantibacter sp. M259 TaxID=2583822 RepID=UPI0011103A84|nr:hypothetical protein [Plantibacter sp. M259]
MSNARTKVHRVLTTFAVTGALLVGGAVTAPAASAIEYVRVTGDTFLVCALKRAQKINQLEKLGYAVDAGGCSQILTVHVAKIAYWKK